MKRLGKDSVWTHKERKKERKNKKKEQKTLCPFIELNISQRNFSDLCGSQVAG